ncbi:MAG: hypothetical protein H7Y37_01885 [Anaerolineae bacterium]|nr:hypothetical protein [Gloeobacterales cyanobacterium ES-bin-313]
MDLKDQLIRAAEDELTQYSTDLRKIEKLRPKVSLRMTPGDRQRLREELTAELAANAPWSGIVEKNRQAAALPFWGIFGLGLLLGALGTTWAFGVGILGAYAGFLLQRWGWQLQARRLLLQTLDDVDRRAAA